MKKLSLLFIFSILFILSIGLSPGYAAPVPSMSLAVPPQPFIGQNFSFTATFDNTSATDTGYGPFIDLIFPVIGTDGALAAVDDGIDFVSAAYLGVPLNAADVRVLTFPSSGSGCTGGLRPVNHPFAVDTAGAPLIVCGTPGNKLVVLRLPFGSFTPDQPPAAVTVNATLSNLADLNTALTIRSRAGFQFGASAVNDPVTDPTIIGPDNSLPLPNDADINSNNWSISAVTSPQLLTLTKTYNGPENETATGPNYPRQYTITVNIAPGQTITNLDITDNLPDNMQFISVNTNPAATCNTQPSTSTPGGNLICTFASVTNSASVTFSYYIPLLDASINRVINAATGDDVVSNNNALAVGDWTPIDTRDAGGTDNAVANPAGFEHVLNDKSIAIQKGVTNITDATNSPGDVLQYTLTFQISDYFAFDGISLTDVISDGQHFDNSFTPTMTVNGNLSPANDSSGNMNPLNYVVTCNYTGGPGPECTINNPLPDDGSSTILFNVSGELISRSQPSRLVGGCIDPSTSGTEPPDCTAYNNGPTTVTVVFHTQIQENFTDITGDLSVDQGDSLSDTVTVNAEVLNNGTLGHQDPIQLEDDGSSAGLSIQTGSLLKTIYAINGTACSPQPCTNVRVKPGDTITYRIHYTLPTSDVENLHFHDYLPLPVFDASEVTTFNDVISAAVPAAGNAKFGPADTFRSYSGIVPTISHPGSNSVVFTYGNYDDTDNQSTIADFLFTVTVSDDPFADGLYLTNQARAHEANSQNNSTEGDSIVQILLTEPQLNIRKGVVSTDNTAGTYSPSGRLPSNINMSTPGNSCPRISGTGMPVNSSTLGTTFNSNLSNVDASDLVTFAIVIENTGRSVDGAFDIKVRDTLPAGLSIPSGGLNLCVTDGTGATISYTNIGSGFFDTSGGIELTDPGPTANPPGALDNGKDSNDATITTGRNIAIITFDLQLDANVTPRQLITNTATLFYFSNGEGGDNFIPDGLTDTATVTVAPPAMAKTITSVSPYGVGSSNHVSAGDTITYNIAVTLPEGQTPGLVITDTLPAGFQYVASSVTVVTGTFNGTVTTTPTVTPSSYSPPTRQTVQIDFGAVTTTNDNQSTNNRFDVTLQALVTNNAANDGLPSQQSKANDVSLNFTGNPGNAITSSVTTQFREPELQISKGITPANPDAGDTVTFTITVQNNGTSPVYDVTVTDNLSLNTISNLIDLSTVACGTTQCSLACNYSNPVVTYTTAGPIADKASCVLTFTATVRSDVVTGSSYQNTVSVTGDSQPGDITEERDTTASNNANASTPSSNAAKEVFATSENGTDPGDANKNSNPPVAIGEVVTYRVTFNLPEGVTRTVTLSDTLPAGMSYITGTSRLERVFNNNIQAVNNVGDSGGINAAASGTFVNLTDGVDVAIAGQVISISLGNVTNSDNDGSAESYVLEIKAVVQNVAGNNAGTTLGNKGTVSYQNYSGTTFNVDSNTINVHVAEPVVQVAKTANPLTAGGGDTIAFTLTITNNSTGPNAASAFEWVITDTLPSDYEAPFAVTNIDAGTTGATVNASFTSNTLNGTIDRLDPGESITIEYTATLKTSVLFGQIITNTANVTTTSLPGTNGTGDATPGGSGTSTGERTGSGSDNDLYGSDPANVTINIPNLTKEIINLQSYYAVADIPIFRITLSVPLGVTNNLILTDVLPSELGYNGSLNVALPAGATSSHSPLNDGNPAFFSQAGNTLTFDFGTLTAPASGNITITYNTIVLNVPANQDGYTPAKNTVTVRFADPNNVGNTLQVGPVENEDQVRVGEPNLLMNKVITAGATGSDAGDTVSWQVTIQNTGHTTAYQLSWQDVLPEGLYQISNPGVSASGGNVYLNGTANAVGTGNVTISSSDADPEHLNNTISLPLLQIEAGATLTVTFDSKLTDSVIQGEVLNNETRASYTSIVNGGRDNTSEPGNVDDDDNTDLNNYEESTSQSLTVDAEIAIDKTVNRTTFTIGENVVYTIRVDVIEGVTLNVSVTDILPDGLTYVSHNIAVGHIGLEFGNAGYNTPSFNGQEITFDFGNVSNDANLSSTDDFFTIEITAHVDNVTGNQNGVILRNNTYLLYGSGQTRLDFDYDANTPEIEGLPITIIEPELNIAKTVDPSSQSLGDIVTYTVTVRHTGGLSTADAYDLVITDVLPIDLSYVPGSASLPPADVTVIDPHNLEFRISSLTLLNGSASFTYQAQIDINAVVEQPLTNDMRLTYKSLAGANGAPDSGRTGDDGEGGNLNDYADSTSADVTPNAAAFIDAVKIVSDLNGGVVQPGDVLHYTVTLHNTNGPVTGVVFYDTIPVHTSYVAGSLSSTKGITDESGLPTLAVNIGPMASDETITITFNVTVNTGTQNGTVISNQGIVNSDQTVPEPTDVDGNDRNGDQPTDVVVGVGATNPHLRVEKYVSWLNDNDSSGSVTPGDTMQYYIAFINDGGTNLTNVHLTDTIPAGLTYINGTASISAGSVTIVGNAVTADIPSLPAGQGENLIFNVTVNQAGTFQNQGIAIADGGISTQSDGDGNPDNGEQPTIFVAVQSGSGTPNIQIQKASELYQDNNQNGILNPGDVLRYTIYITNTGSAAALNVRLTDPIPANTALVAGSVVTGKGIVITENPVDVNIGTVNPGELVTVQFRVTLPPVLPTGTEIHNTATVTASGGITTQATRNDPVTSAPNFYDPQNVVKTVEFSIDGMNRYLTYTALIISTGDAPAGNVVFNDPIPANAAYVPDTITLNGSPVSDAYPDADGGFDNIGNRIVVNIGTLNPGVQTTITFRVLIDTYYSGDISNQGTLTGDNFPDEPTDDPNTDDSNDPTIIYVKPIPTLNEWGIICFIVLAGIGSIYYIRKQQKA